MFGPTTSKTLINDILSLLSFFDDEFVVNGIYNDADGVIAGNVAGSSKGILGDVKCTMIAQIGPFGSPAVVPNTI